MNFEEKLAQAIAYTAAVNRNMFTHISSPCSNVTIECRVFTFSPDSVEHASVHVTTEFIITDNLYSDSSLMLKGTLKDFDISNLATQFYREILTKEKMAESVAENAPLDKYPSYPVPEDLPEFGSTQATLVECDKVLA